MGIITSLLPGPMEMVTITTSQVTRLASTTSQTAVYKLLGKTAVVKTAVGTSLKYGWLVATFGFGLAYGVGVFIIGLAFYFIIPSVLAFVAGVAGTFSDELKELQMNVGGSWNIVRIFLGVGGFIVEFITAVLEFIASHIQQILLLGGVVVILWFYSYVFEENLPAVKNFVVHGSATAEFGINMGQTMFATSIEINDLIRPYVNSGFKNAAHTTNALYSCVQITNFESAITSTSLGTDDILGGRRLGEVIPKVIDGESVDKITKFEAIYITFSEASNNIGVIFLELACESHIMEYIEPFLELFAALVTKLYCAILGQYCTILEVLDALFLLLCKFFSFGLGCQGQVTVGVSCKGGMFPPGVTSSCRGNLFSINPPGLFVNAPVQALHDRVLITCDHYNGRFQEAVHGEVTSSTYNETTACPFSKRTFDPYQNTFNMDMLKVVDCYKACIYGVQYRVCGDGKRYYNGSCFQHERIKKTEALRRVRRLAPSGFFHTEDGSGGSSKILSRAEMIESIKTPGRFNIKGMGDCDVTKPPQNIWDILIDGACVASYLHNKRTMEQQSSGATAGGGSYGLLEIMNNKVRRLLHDKENNQLDRVARLTGVMKPLSHVLKKTTAKVNHFKARRRALHDAYTVHRRQLDSTCLPGWTLCLNKRQCYKTDPTSECRPVIQTSSFIDALTQYQDEFHHKLSEFELFSFLDGERKCYLRQREDPSIDPTNPDTFDLTCEQKQLLLYCFPQSPPSCGYNPTYVQLNGQAFLDQACANGCNCPFLDVTLAQVRTHGIFTTATVYHVYNGALCLYFLVFVLNPLVWIINAIFVSILPADVYGQWLAIDGDYTFDEWLWCFVAHLGSLGIMLVILFIAYSMWKIFIRMLRYLQGREDDSTITFQVKKQVKEEMRRILKQDSMA